MQPPYRRERVHSSRYHIHVANLALNCVLLPASERAVTADGASVNAHVRTMAVGKPDAPSAPSATKIHSIIRQRASFMCTTGDGEAMSVGV